MGLFDNQLGALDQNQQQLERMQKQLGGETQQQAYTHVSPPLSAQLKEIIGILKQESTQFRNHKDGEAEIQKLLENPVFDRALGCVYGAFIGDALGSYCEFQSYISEELINEVMMMKGGGTFHTVPGQVTDDSELALHLGAGLTTYTSGKSLREQHYLILKNIADGYVKWMTEDRPFDIGNTTATAIRELLHSSKGYEGDAQKYVKTAKAGIAEYNDDSQSNGCLMRITPMAAFAAALSLSEQKQEEDIDALIQGILFRNSDEVQLTHSNKLIVAACLEWVRLLKNLILKKNSFKDIYSETEQRCNRNTGLKEWMKQSKDELMQGTPNMGWAKIAWTYGIHEFRVFNEKQKSPSTQLYTDVMRRVIMKGGDTDTNACIVGGVIGSIIGFKLLPTDYLKKSLTVNCPTSPQKRLAFYNPVNAFDIVRKMFAHIPK